MTALRPRKKHPADAGQLTAISSDLATQALSTVRTNGTIQQAYAPAPTNWDGTASPELASAPQWLSNDSEAVSTALAWASVATAAWADSVQRFNAEVDRIVNRLESLAPTYGAHGSDGQPPTETEVAQATAAAQRDADRAWEIAYDHYIESGRGRVESILQDGPSDVRILELFEAGLLPFSLVAACCASARPLYALTGGHGGAPHTDVAVRAGTDWPGGQMYLRAPTYSSA